MTEGAGTLAALTVQCAVARNDNRGVAPTINGAAAAFLREGRARSAWRDLRSAVDHYGLAGNEVRRS